MRHIVYFDYSGCTAAQQQNILNICSHYTPLIEPGHGDGSSVRAGHGDGSSVRQVYLDLTGCGPTKTLLKNITAQILKTTGLNTFMGWASSKLTARLAASAKKPNTSCYQVIKYPGAHITRVLPELEHDFIGSLSLPDFYPFSQEIVKKLSRAGFSTIADIRDLSPYQLSRWLGKDHLLVWELCQGHDNSPVIGQYPPSSITYPMAWEETYNWLLIDQLLSAAAAVLSAHLLKKQQCCRLIRLEFAGHCSIPAVERKLSWQCYSHNHLLNVCRGLWSQVDVNPAITEARIVLGDLSPLQLSQPDLFSWRTAYKTEQRQQQLDNELEIMLARFPGLLSRGLPINRREAVLALWDPWRG